MRFVHTADAHLHPEKPDRMAALRRVCRTAEECEAGLLVVAGDLFDSAEAAVALGPEVRALFNGFPLPVLLVGGNHDEGAYGSGKLYGDRVSLVGRGAPRVLEYDGVPFAGLAFDRGARASQALDAAPRGTGGVLVTHASFYARDARWAAIPGELRGQQETNDFYLVQEHLAGRGFDYVALGHWHRATDPPLSLGTTQVAYSGSACPTAADEIGPRKVAVVDLAADGSATVCLRALEGVPYNVRRSWFVVMGREGRVLEDVAAFVAGAAADPLASIQVEVTGYLERNEESFRTDLDAACRAGGAGDRVRLTFSPAQLPVSGLPAVNRFAERMLSAPAPDLATLFQGDNAELIRLAREALEDEATLDGLRAHALEYGLRSFQRVLGR